MASDLISREAMLDALGVAFKASDPEGEEQIGYLNARLIAREIPSVDAVEVVRCAECVNRGDLEKCPMCYQYLPEWFPRDNTDDDGFCHRGVKKDEVD